MKTTCARCAREYFLFLRNWNLYDGPKNWMWMKIEKVTQSGSLKMSSLLWPFSSTSPATMCGLHAQEEDESSPNLQSTQFMGMKKTWQLFSSCHLKEELNTIYSISVAQQMQFCLSFSMLFLKKFGLKTGALFWTTHHVTEQQWPFLQITPSNFCHRTHLFLHQ